MNVADQMREHFGVGIRAKVCVAVLNELFLERLIIFDYAVVHERDLARGVEMRMRVVIRDFAVSRPTRVTDSVMSGSGLLRNQLRERRNSPRALARLEMVAVNNGDAGGIVPAIFEAAEPIEQNRRRFLASDITNDSAHSSGED